MSSLGCDAKLVYFPGAKTKDWNGDEVKKLANMLKVGVSTVPAYLTGGNVMFDGQDMAISTCITLNENQHFKISSEDFFDHTKHSFGIKQYHIIPNFEQFGIQHIDCFLKLIDEESFLIARPPIQHESFQLYQDLVAQISKLKTRTGRPYKIYRINAGEVTNSAFGDDFEQYFEQVLGQKFESVTKGIAAYTNSLILNKRIFVPLYGISTDKAALETWRAIMPGYEVKGYEFTERTGSKIPWQSFDALHCRTRAVWDPQMLYLSHHRIGNPVAASSSGYEIRTKIVDYSATGLVEKSLQLSWRRGGETEWNKLPLKPTGDDGSFSAVIPTTVPDTRLEYFISAADQSGRGETLPRTAPKGFYSFKVTR